MKQKTAMQLAIEALEQKKKNLHEMDLLGVLLLNEYAHKQNEINSIQIMLAKYLPAEREQIEEAYWAGLDGLMNDYSECETFGDDKTKTGGGASFHYQQKYGDEPTIKND